MFVCTLFTDRSAHSKEESVCLCVCVCVMLPLPITFSFTARQENCIPPNIAQSVTMLVDNAVFQSR